MREPLWIPGEERVARSHMMRFMGAAGRRAGRPLEDYRALWEWSVEDIPAFWDLFWEFAGIRASRKYDRVVDHPERMPGAEWFPGARLNFAENLLRYRDDQTALVGVGEGRATFRLSYGELWHSVARLARGLRAAGIGPGDRVAGLMPNIPETVVAMLAATSLGAVWTSSAPEFGVAGVLSRFSQARPRVLFAADGYVYGGKRFDVREKVAQVAKELPDLAQVVLVGNLTPHPSQAGIPRAVGWDDFLGPHDVAALEFEQMPASHPLYTMYSSGTTGVPKCIVQSAGGILLQHMKELMLHTDVKREDVLFYYTNCGWMMWNWLVSGLSLGATLVLYDGAPLAPHPLALWELAQREGITIFGTSARYLSALHKDGHRPGAEYDLSALRTVLSTGSPLPEEGFEYVYRDVKRDVQLSSISGGTDLNGCLAIGNPVLPVYAGELQCRPLAMQVDAFDPNGQPVRDRKGELVCLTPFPSMPLGLCSDADGSRYRAAYFERFPGIWHHGDYVEIREETGGLVIYGRSDATLNPGGVRIGTAELYPAVERVEEVADSIAVAQEWEGDQRVVLFVKLKPGVSLDDALVRRIKSAVRTHASPRHVPAVVLAVSDIPYTLSGKKVELAVREVVHGRPVENLSALANPDCLADFRDREELRR